MTTLEIDGYLHRVRRLYKRHDHEIDRMIETWERYHIPNEDRKTSFWLVYNRQHVEHLELWLEIEKEIRSR